MEINGEDVIVKIVDRLKFKGALCTDANIIQTVRDLDNYQLAQLVNLGDVDGWKTDRLAKEE